MGTTGMTSRSSGGGATILSHSVELNHARTIIWFHPSRSTWAKSSLIHRKWSFSSILLTNSQTTTSWDIWWTCVSRRFWCLKMMWSAIANTFLTLTDVTSVHPFSMRPSKCPSKWVVNAHSFLKRICLKVVQEQCGKKASCKISLRTTSTYKKTGIWNSTAPSPMQTSKASSLEQRSCKITLERKTKCQGKTEKLKQDKFSL